MVGSCSGSAAVSGLTGPRRLPPAPGQARGSPAGAFVVRQPRGSLPAPPSSFPPFFPFAPSLPLLPPPLGVLSPCGSRPLAGSSHPQAGRQVGCCEGAWGGDICVMVVATGMIALLGQGGAWGGDTVVHALLYAFVNMVVVATGIVAPGASPAPTEGPPMDEGGRAIWVRPCSKARPGAPWLL